MSKNIVITGGLGFIGTNLADLLLKKEDCVLYLVDDLSTGRFENLTWLYRNNRDRTGAGQVNFIKSDITSPTFSKTMNANLGMKLDQIYHLACPASPPKYWKDPLKTLDINYVGTKNVLELGRKYDADFLFTSTSEIYGDPEKHPQSEDYNGNVNPISPRSVYDEGKRVAETLVSEYHRQYGIMTKIARIFNTYGPHMDPDDGRVVTNFLKAGLQSVPLDIYGDGKQTRSLCFVEDNVRALYKLMETPLFENEPVNIGNPDEYTILELAEIVFKTLNMSPIYTFKDLPPSDPKKRKPDIEKISSLGWSPKVSLTDGLKQTIEYMKEQLPWNQD